MRCPTLFEEPHPRHDSTVGPTFSIADLTAEAFAGREAKRRDVADGSGRIFEVGASPVLIAGDPAARDVVLVLRDVTEDRERRRAHDHSERMRALGETMATVAHELNNPLTAVVGFAALVNERAPDEVRRPCQVIREQAERCLAIVRDVLGFARTGRQTADTTFDIREVARGVLEPMRDELSRTSIDVRFDGGSCAVLGDAQRVHQVLVNLVRNAIEALVEGGSRERVIGISTVAEDRRCFVTVTDTGPGIAPEIRPHLFKPFATTRGKGTGLGLSVCASIVREHGGTLRCDNSRPGLTRFTFDLPLGAGASAASRHGTTGGMVRPRRLLVAEDEEPVRELLTDYLGRQGHEVVFEVDGVGALRRLTDDPGFEVVLLDLHLPGLTGLDVLRELERAGSPLLARCYVMSGEVDEAVFASALRMAAGGLRKPFTISDLRRVLAAQPLHHPRLM